MKRLKKYSFSKKDLPIEVEVTDEDGQFKRYVLVAAGRKKTGASLQRINLLPAT